MPDEVPSDETACTQYQGGARPLRGKQFTVELDELLIEKGDSCDDILFHIAGAFYQFVHPMQVSCATRDFMQYWSVP